MNADKMDKVDELVVFMEQEPSSKLKGASALS
jgi:hypothetical protein